MNADSPQGDAKEKGKKSDERSEQTSSAASAASSTTTTAAPDNINGNSNGNSSSSAHPTPVPFKQNDPAYRSVPLVWGSMIQSVLYSESSIATRVKELASQISADYTNPPFNIVQSSSATSAAAAASKSGASSSSPSSSSSSGGGAAAGAGGGENNTPLLVIGLLKGAVMFLTDLARHLSVPYQIDFLTASSYGSGTTTTGSVKIRKDVDIDPSGRHVLLVEDLIDTGTTLDAISRHLLLVKHVKSLRIACLLDKKARRTVPMNVDYVGFQCPDYFVIGYGMDFNEDYRALPFVGVLKPEAYRGLGHGH